MATTFELQGDFRSEVLEASKSVPVVVDFWAEWCGPCRTLGPILENLAAAANGRWKLVKVNTELHPEIAQAFQIRSIPAVKMFENGRPVAEFLGALPEPQVRQWLDQQLPDPGRAQLERARQMIQAGDVQAAVAVLEELVNGDPADGAARLELARALLRDDPHQARELLVAITEDSPEWETAQHLAHVLRLIEWARGGPVELSHVEEVAGEVVESYRQGAEAFAQGDYAEALERWIEVIGQDRRLDDDGARKTCLAVFALLGEESQVTQTYRRRFSSVLF